MRSPAFLAMEIMKSWISRRLGLESAIWGKNWNGLWFLCKSDRGREDQRDGTVVWKALGAQLFCWVLLLGKRQSYLPSLLIAPRWGSDDAACRVLVMTSAHVGK